LSEWNTDFLGYRFPFDSHCNGRSRDFLNAIAVKNAIKGKKTAPCYWISRELETCAIKSTNRCRAANMQTKTVSHIRALPFRIAV